MKTVLLFLLAVACSVFAAEQPPKYEAVAVIGDKQVDGFAKFIYDKDVYSPKSVVIDDAKNLFYVQALEGGKTLCYGVDNLKKECSVKHLFDANEQKKHQDMDEQSIFKQPKKLSPWLSKPVESVLDNNGKYLYVTSYRKSFDKDGKYASSISVIDTTTDKLVASLPSDSIPKIIKLSHDGSILAVTNWGNNSVTFWSLGGDVNETKLLNHVVLEKSAEVKSGVNRDKECGLCLRGSIFSSDDKYLIVTGMHSDHKAYLVSPFDGLLKTIDLPFKKIRHIAASDKEQKYIFSTLSDGKLCSVDYADISIDNNASTTPKSIKCKNYNSPIRTIDINEKLSIGIATLNSACKIAIFDTKSMDILQELPSPCYPVGAAISKDGDTIITTSQGKGGKNGNKIAVYKRKK